MTNPAIPDPAIVRLPSLHPNVTVLSSSPDGKWLAAGAHFTATVQVWNLENYSRRTIVPQPGNPTPSFTVGFTPDSRSLVISCSYEVLDGGHKFAEAQARATAGQGSGRGLAQFGQVLFLAADFATAEQARDVSGVELRAVVAVLVGVALAAERAPPHEVGAVPAPGAQEICGAQEDIEALA